MKNESVYLRTILGEIRGCFVLVSSHFDLPTLESPNSPCRSLRSFRMIPTASRVQDAFAGFAPICLEPHYQTHDDSTTRRLHAWSPPRRHETLPSRRLPSRCRSRDACSAN